ncbi:uncharacterized protein LAESUDRAFT_787000 [Laetiporus sulphureus 93-53]|uniref:Uncharacterized protein n=1 Tax=Laetiporus sulphureus 93-53 TaxID=1314785 RepID=A0A165CZX8_9APHY|nr:uncharacterized protein LAESUDRAFT_787000 [Laetiporus sulphureus 93-53]KZT03854.1 hypothetical protein LAESUDRAFT_787000 [Laetiporus sulphureus 93-53]
MFTVPKLSYPNVVGDALEITTRAALKGEDVVVRSGETDEDSSKLLSELEQLVKRSLGDIYPSSDTYMCNEKEHERKKKKWKTEGNDEAGADLIEFPHHQIDNGHRKRRRRKASRAFEPQPHAMFWRPLRERGVKAAGHVMGYGSSWSVYKDDSLRYQYQTDTLRKEQRTLALSYARVVRVHWLVLWIIPRHDLLPLIPIPTLPPLLRPGLLATGEVHEFKVAPIRARFKCKLQQFEHLAVDRVDANGVDN